MRRTWSRAVRVVVLAGIAACAAHCASPPEAPGWLKGAPQGYPEDQYVWGVGAGVNAESAASAARAEIGRKTKGEAEGVRIAETWVDEKPTVYWALAVLDRTALIARLGEEVAASETQLSQLLETAEGAPPGDALEAVVRTIELTPRRDALLLRIVNLGGTPPAFDPLHERAALEKRLASIKRSLVIDVQAYEMDSKTGAIGDPLDEIRRVLAQQVLEKGFRMALDDDWGGGSPAWLLARARVAFERLDLGPRGSLVAVHWEAALEVEDRSGNGEVVAIRMAEARATHLNEREARRQAQEDAEAFLAAALASWLDERFTPGLL